MKMNKVVLGLALVFAANVRAQEGSLLGDLADAVVGFDQPKQQEVNKLEEAIKDLDLAEVKEIAEKASDATLTQVLNDSLANAEKAEAALVTLIEEGADVNRETLSQALESGSLDTIATVIEHMTTEELAEKNAEGQTVAQEIEEQVSAITGALAKRGAKLTPGMQNRAEHGKKIREARQSRKELHADRSRRQSARSGSRQKVSKAGRYTGGRRAHSNK